MTEGKQFFDLKDAIENLVKQLQCYESDTFSASDEGVDRVMAERMAAWLIRTQLFDAEGMPGDGIDGAVVGTSKDAVVEAFSLDANDLRFEIETDDDDGKVVNVFLESQSLLVAIWTPLEGLMGNPWVADGYEDFAEQIGDAASDFFSRNSDGTV